MRGHNRDCAKNLSTSTAMTGELLDTRYANF